LQLHFYQNERATVHDCITEESGAKLGGVIRVDEKEIRSHVDQVARDPVDMRKSFHGLIGLTESVLEQDPLSGHLFVFINASQTSRSRPQKEWSPFGPQMPPPLFPCLPRLPDLHNPGIMTGPSGS